MANTDIYPYGQGGTMPEGYPMTSSLDENNAQKASTAAAAYKLKRMIGGTNKVVVAAANTPADMQSAAKYVCDGTNDETELNAAIAECLNDKKELLILRGDYYLDAPTKQYSSSNDTFLLVDTSPVGGAPSKKLVMYGENPAERPVIHISDAGYEALSASKQYSVFAVYDSSNYGGFIELRNIMFVYPWNQKKICAVDFWRYGGHARLHSIGLTAYTSGYNGTPGINIGNPPPVAAEGCIGLRFIGKGPNGSYGSEITDCTMSGFNEGICINTEWCLCNHVASIFCVTGWVFGKYRLSVSGQYSTSIHPLLLLCCGDERGVNLPVFYACQEGQDIEMYAFTIERTSTIVPGGTLGNLARVVSTGAQGEFRGVINYTVQHHEEGAKNSVSVGFWEFGHGHGMRTTDMAHKQAGTTAERNAYRPNYMQRYFDTTLGKEIICVDESGNNGKGTWKDTAGNTV